MTRLKLAELTAGIGALVLGVGLGALLSQWFAPAAGLIAVAGIVAHGFGMWDKHRLEAQRDSEVNEPLVVVLYWVCWLLLVGVVAVLFVWR
jgi:4-hydroxybenzoate polyprenyltransferase